MAAANGRARSTPWIGVVLFFSFAALFFRFYRLNLWRSEDSAWLAGASDVLTAHEERLPEVGKYNAGQKLVFWSMSLLIIVLIVSGLIIWDQYFLAYATGPGAGSMLTRNALNSGVSELASPTTGVSEFGPKPFFA